MSARRMMRSGPGIIVLAVVFLSAPSGGARAGASAGDHFSSAAEAIRIMESPFRARWQMPEKVVEALMIAPGMAIGDIGAGSGYFTALFSEKVGAAGAVYAVDIDDGMIEHLRRRAKGEGRENVHVIAAKPDDPLLADDSVDLVFLCNTYTYIEKRKEYLAKVRRILKKDGRLAIIDFHPASTPVGPPAGRRMAKDAVIEEAAQKGFSVQTTHEFLPYQYFVVFTVQGRP